MNFKSLACAILAISLLSACTEKKSETEIKFVGGSHDAFHVVVPEGQLPPDTWVRPTDCRANIAQVLCEVEPASDWSQGPNRPCLGGEQKYQSVFEKIYDDLDPINQKMFCSLRKIFIERSFYATGYASQYYVVSDKGEYTKLPGAIMGIRKSVLDSTPALDLWATWKEQLNFTEIADEFTTPLAYPRFQGTNSPSLLHDVIVHEFGHMLDFANTVNKELLGKPDCFDNGGKFQSEEEFYEKCEPYADPATWTAISWKNGITPKAENDFPGRSKLCFYNCKDRMDLNTEMVPFYLGLAQSDFVTSYAASNYMDDFAEAWSMYWLLYHFKGDISILASPEIEVKVRNIYESEKFKAKKEYIEKFVQKELKYP